MVRFYVFLLVCCWLPACATVNHGASDHFRIDSAPQGAIVTTSLETRDSKKRRAKDPSLEKEFIGCAPTPCSIKLSRHSRFIATVEHEGYEPGKIFVDSSGRQGSFAGNMFVTTATVTGSAALGAATAAALTTVIAELSGAIVSASLNAFSYGLINVPASSVTVATTSSSSAAAAALPPALAVSGSMLLIDAASGANKNLFPNPVVLGLAPEGSEVLVDPFVILHSKELEAQDSIDLACHKSNVRDKAGRDSCAAAKAALTEATKSRRDFQKVFFDALKEDAKAAREAEKQAENEARD